MTDQTRRQREEGNGGEGYIPQDEGNPMSDSSFISTSRISLLMEEPPPPPPPPRSYARSGSNRSNKSGIPTISTSSRSMNNNSQHGSQRKIKSFTSSKSGGDGSASTKRQHNRIKENPSNSGAFTGTDSSGKPLMVHTGQGDIELTDLDKIRSGNRVRGIDGVGGVRAKIGAKVKQKLNAKRLQGFERAAQAMMELNDNSGNHIHVPTVYFDEDDVDDGDDKQNSSGQDDPETANVAVGALSSPTSTVTTLDEDVDWTPQDSSYGAACPVCGCIPKSYRQNIEYVITMLAMAGLVAVTTYLISSLTFFHSSSHASTGKYNSTSISSKSLLDDDFYIEVTNNGKNNQEEVYYNDYLNNQYGVANDDDQYYQNKLEEAYYNKETYYNDNSNSEEYGYYYNGNNDGNENEYYEVNADENEDADASYYNNESNAQANNNQYYKYYNNNQKQNNNYN